MAEVLVLGDGEGAEGGGTTTDDDTPVSTSSSQGSGQDDAPGRGVQAGRGGGRQRGLDGEAWNQKWLEQARREGLAGALVALSYPDRLAVRSDRSNTRATYALAGGGNVRLASDDDPLAQVR